MILRQLQRKCDSKLESVGVLEDDIADFLQTARKYDVDFALKKDSSTAPPMYHVFFSAFGNDRFDQIFSEYVGKMRDRLLERGEMHRDDLKQQAQTIARPAIQKGISYAYRIADVRGFQEKLMPFLNEIGTSFAQVLLSMI